MTKFLEMIYEAAKKEDEERTARERAAAEKKAAEYNRTIKIIEDFIDMIPSRDDIKINAEDGQMVIPIFKDKEPDVFKAFFDCSVAGNVYDFENVKSILMLHGYFVNDFHELDYIDYRILVPPKEVPVIYFVVTWKYRPQ